MGEVDYQEYHFSRREFIYELLKGIIKGMFIGFVFYDSYIVAGLCSCFVFLFLKIDRKEKIKRRREQLIVQFKDSILMLSASLNAGYSLENGLRQITAEVERLYGDCSDMAVELKNINHKISMNISPEEAFFDFAGRCKEEDIENFAEVLQIGKRMGGNLIQIIQMAAKNISEKIEVRQEIQTMIGKKKLEYGIMKKVPIFMICYLKVASPEILQPIYGNLYGFFFATCCLGIYGIIVLYGDRLLEIEV